MEIGNYKKQLVDLLLSNGLISPEVIKRILPQEGVANASTGKSQWPLLDELSPPITPAQGGGQPEATAQQQSSDAALQELLYMLFKTQPRNKLREAGLE